MLEFGFHNPSCQARTWHHKTLVLKLPPRAAPSAQHLPGHHSESPTDERADVAKILPLLQFAKRSTGCGRLPNFSNFLSWMCCSPRLEKCHSFPHSSSLSYFFFFLAAITTISIFSHSFLPGNKNERKRSRSPPQQHLDHSFEHSAQVGGTQHSAGCCRALTSMLHSGSLQKPQNQPQAGILLK